MNRYPVNRYTGLHPAEPRRRRWPLVLLLLVLGLGGYFGYRLLGDSLPLKTTKSSQVAAEPKPTLNTSQASAMASQINSVISNYPDMDIGVAVLDLNNNHSYHYGVSSPFIAASISKVLTATLFLHQVENGQQSLNEDVGGQTAQYELQQLIEISDDTAWANLNDLLGHDALASYASSIGLQNYDPEQNTLTVDDISLLLAKLYKGELLNAQHTQLLLSYLQDANYNNWIVANVPPGVKTYHKIGFLDDRVNDAAIIDNAKHPYVLVIFTKEDDGSDYDNAEGQQIFAQITTATTDAFL